MKRKLEPVHDEHINVTPLIDIVMCLIIFFMVCGKLAKNEFEGGLLIPKAGMAQELGEQKGRLVINVLPDPAVDARNVLARPLLMIRGNQVSYEDLTKVLRAAKSESPDLRLLVRADRGLIYSHISPVLVSCAQADIKSIHFATELAQ